MPDSSLQGDLVVYERADRFDRCDAVGGVARVERDPGLLVVDGNPDLHLVDAVAANPHAVGKDQRMPDLPVVGLLALPLEQTTLDDAVLKRVERHLDVLDPAEGGGKLEAPPVAQPVEVAVVQPLHMVRVDRVLHGLQPVARDRRVTHVAHSIHHVAVVAGQQWGGLGPHVGPHHAAERLGAPRAQTHLVLERRLLPSRGLLDALALEVELPSVVSTPNSASLGDAVDHGGAPVRAALVADAIGPVGRSVHRKRLPQQARAFDGEVFEFAARTLPGTSSDVATRPSAFQVRPW